MTSIDDYLAQAKSAQGLALGRVIYDVVHAPCIYHFNSLLRLPSISSLRGSEHQSWLTLLELFAFGNIKDYHNLRHGLPPVNNEAVIKLTVLSLLTVATTNTVLTFVSLLINSTYYTLI